jgi:hypothetical protein
MHMYQAETESTRQIVLQTQLDIQVIGATARSKYEVKTGQWHGCKAARTHLCTALGLTELTCLAIPLEHAASAALSPL